MGFFSKDRSDARGTNADGTPGSGVGYAPVPSDARDPKDEIPDSLPFKLNPTYGVSPAVSDSDVWTNDPSDTRTLGDENSPAGSGAQMGTPELEYEPMRQAGQRAVDVGPLDGGLTDPIRDSLTPTRRAITRFFFTRAAWKNDIRGEFARPGRDFVGQDNRGAAMPQGRMSPMDEYRLLGDGSHA